MTTAERLHDYYPYFAPTTLETVAEFTDKLAQYDSYGKFFDDIGVTDPKIWGHNPVEILDIRPKEHDPDTAILVRLPMANPLDPNMIYQVATIAGTNPNQRVIAAGNPSGGKYKAGGMPRAIRKAVATGNFGPLAWPLSHYAYAQKIQQVDEVGYSFGAHLAVSSGDMPPVRRVVAIEPVVGRRTLRSLGADFGSTEAHLKSYVKASDLTTFEQARQDSVSKIGYFRGLLRPTNTAAAQALTKNNFENYTHVMLQKDQPELAAIVWGTKSELAIHGLMQQMMRRLSDIYGDRVFGMPIQGQYHALANDLPLQDAIIREALHEL